MNDNTNTPAPAALQKKERKQLIQQQVDLHTQLLFTDLVQLIDVSEDTIRRDVNELAEEGLVVRIKGGALSAGYHKANASTFNNRQAKDTIATKALQLLKEDMIVVLDGGPLIREFIKHIPATLRATFITTNVRTAVELLDKPLVKTIVTGGQIASHHSITVSGETFQALHGIRADLCLLNAEGIDANNGLTSTDWETAQVKKAMIKAAAQLVVLSLAEQLNSVLLIQIAATNAIDHLITELPSTDPALAAFKTRNYPRL